MEIDAPQHKLYIHSLRVHWIILAGISLGFLITTGRLLSISWNQSVALRWSMLSLGITLVMLWTLWHNLHTNHRQGESHVLPSLGAGNIMTFLRGLFIAATAG
jgi:hypothetical protein